jgi:hypothetical protein
MERGRGATTLVRRPSAVVNLGYSMDDPKKPKTPP